jgi:C-terminal processing protease CtpA/Prc
MKRKVSLSTTVTLVLLTMALTVSLTMLLAMRHFNDQLQLVSQRQAMYSHINDVDKKVREYYPDLDEESLRRGIAQGYIYGLNDPYAVYYDPARYAAEKLRLAGKANNVGVTLSLDANARVVVSRVQPNSAAGKAGVRFRRASFRVHHPANTPTAAKNRPSSSGNHTAVPSASLFVQEKFALVA